MPKTVFGIGTREYGKRDREANGSYLTTKFFVFFFIPLWPMESRRLRRVHGEDFTSVRRLALCWPQVIKILAAGYGICLAIVGLLALGMVFAPVLWREAGAWISLLKHLLLGGPPTR